METAMLDDLPAPFRSGTIKVWPVHSKPEFQWFIAYEGKPYYFKTKQEALLFARDAQSEKDPEGLCD
jgi:YHS domain-containing protein